MTGELCLRRRNDIRLLIGRTGLLACLAGLSCSDGGDGPSGLTFTTGVVSVSVMTTGPDRPDGFRVALDEGAPRAIDVDGAVSFAGVDPGEHRLTLDAVSDNCAVGGPNPRSVSVTAGETTNVQFSVVCDPLTGTLEVGAETSGSDVDSDGYGVAIDGDSSLPLDVDGSLAPLELRVGSHDVELTDVADNCTVAGENPRTVPIETDAVTSITFQVECDPTTASAPNMAPNVTISSPDPSRDVAPLTVGPGTSVAFSGAADDPEDGPLTGTSLVWTSNVDGQIGTGESFVTGLLSEGQHAVTLTATDSEGRMAFATVLVIVVPPPAPGFQITFRLQEGVALTSGQRAVIEDALSRLESIVTGDVSDVQFERDLMSCAGVHLPALDETIDDLLIYLSIEPIDGQGDILGFAGPCWIRGGSGLPFIGGIRFDIADLDSVVEPNGLLDELLLHEAMHVMGFGTRWNAFGFLEEPSSGNPGADTYFDGPAALARFDVLGGADYTGGNVVPVENDTETYGSGSLDRHWRESVFDDEVMTSSVNIGVNPLSPLTIGQFEDLGYTVDYGAADPYDPVFSLVAPAAVRAERVLPLGDDVWRGPLWMLQPNGRSVRIR